MASEREKICLENFEQKLRQSPGSLKAKNGICQLYKDYISINEYPRLSFRHPEKKNVSSVTVGSMVTMVELKTVSLPKGFDSSHICHNKPCILRQHISFEPHRVNLQRQICVSEGRCLGHGSYADCLVHLKVHACK